MDSMDLALYSNRDCVKGPLKQRSRYWESLINEVQCMSNHVQGSTRPARSTAQTSLVCLVLSLLGLKLLHWGSYSVACSDSTVTDLFDNILYTEGQESNQKLSKRNRNSQACFLVLAFTSANTHHGLGAGGRRHFWLGWRRCQRSLQGPWHQILQGL